MKLSRFWRIAGGTIVSVAIIWGCQRADLPAAPGGASGGRAAPTATEMQSSFAEAGSQPTFTPRPVATTTVTGLKVEQLFDRLNFPQSLTFTPDGRIFFVEVREFRGERDWWGKIRVVKDGKLDPTSLWEARVGEGNEQGLVGLALDPNFSSNHYLYVYYTEGKSGSSSPSAGKLVRLTEQDGKAVGQPVTLINDVEPGKCCHTGGKMVFDKDGMLILAIGDQGDVDRRDAQKAEKFNGKVLRFDPNNLPRAAGDQGKKLSDPRPATIASGLRNPYGIDINPKNGVAYITDNGPDECDEINAVFHAGANFGNPTVECSPGDPNFADPVWDSGPDRLAPTGMRFYQGAMFPEWQDDLLWCAFDTGNLTRFHLSPPEFDRVQSADQILSGAEQGGHGCRLDLSVARDGSIYFSSATAIFRLYR